MEDKNEIEKLEYINTPFSYTRHHKGLTLLQQNIMVKVSAHLQHYLKDYFNNPALVASTERPKPMLSDTDKMQFPAIRVSLSELGVDSAHYDRVRDALADLFKLTVEHDGISEDGKPTKVVLPIFSRQEIPVHENKTTVRKRLNEDDDFLTAVQVDRTRGFVDLKLNPLLLDDLFDMSQGYITHPASIAEIGRVNNMPLLYYLVRHRMQNFRVKTCNITVPDIREYLGTTVKDYKGTVIKNVYPKYSVFKLRVLTPALNDIRRLFDEGTIDIFFGMTEIRLYGKKTGEPRHLRFDLLTEDKKRKPRQQTLFTDAEVVEVRQEYPLQVEEGRALWQKALLAMGTDNEFALWCANNITCLGKRGMQIIVDASIDAHRYFTSHQERERLYDILRTLYDCPRIMLPLRFK